MKKNLLFLLFIAALFTNVNVSAQFTIKNLNFPVQHAGVSAIDIDGDGDYDIVISGEDSANGSLRREQVFLNDGAGNYTPATSTFAHLTRTTFDWGDINQDGKPDVIEAGFDIASNAFTGIYTSNGTGTFAPYTGVTLAQLAPSSGFADLNNDGYLDIYVFGNDNTGGKSRIYFNNQNGGFTTSLQFNNYTFTDPQVTAIDFDNDGDLDLFVDAGYEAGAGTRFSRMFVNNNGTFTELNLGLIPKGNGSAVWGDYDGDGYLDLLLNGDGFLNSGEDNNGIYRLYHNNGGTSFSAADTFAFYRQNSTGGGGRFFDWDNDGKLDIVITGYNQDSGRQATAIFLNNGTTFTAYSKNPQLPGVSENTIEVADIDNDGDLDLILTGYSNNAFNGPGSNFNSNISVIAINPAVLKNTAPIAPGNLAVTGNSTLLNLSWSAGTDATTPQASLSYNIFLVDATGKWFYYPLADTTTGKLKQQKMGNVNLNLRWIIKGLPAGTYRWGVQSIDNSFMGSPFATSSFTVNVDGTLPVNLISYTATAEGKKSRIEWVTSSEQNNNRFEIERSSDGKSFYSLASVQGKGTTGNESHYLIYDNNPSKMNYYKLTQYNIDGKPTIYGIKTVSFNSDSKATVIVYPNPAQSNVGIRLSNFTGKVVNVTITDMTGKLVHTEVIAAENGQGYYPLHFSSKPVSGQYMLSVSGEGLRETLKVILK